MNCPQCGTEIFEGNTFCHICGASVGSAASQTPPVVVAPPPVQNNTAVIAPPTAPVKKSKLPIILAVLLAVAVIGIVIAVIVLGGDSGSNGGSGGGSGDGESVVDYEENRSSYAWLVDEWAEADFLNRTALIDLYHEDHLEYFLNANDMTYSELVNHYRVDNQEQAQNFNQTFGEDWECTYTLVDVNQYSGSRLKSMQSDYQQAGVEVDAYLELSIDLYMEGTKKSTETNFSLYIMLVDGQWYLAQVLE